MEFLNRTRAFIVGVLILLAYGVLVSAFTQDKIAVMVADIVSGGAVIGIALLMFPLFKKIGSNLAKIYLITKYIEGFLMILAGILFLFPDYSHFHNYIYETFQVYAYIVSTYLFYKILYNSTLIPKFISIWGCLGIVSLGIITILGFFDIEHEILNYFLILIVSNEVFLAIYLMIKGFNLKK